MSIFNLLAKNNEWQLLAETISQKDLEKKYNKVLTVFKYEPKIKMTEKELQDKNRAQIEFITYNLNYLFKVIVTKRDDSIHDYFLKKARMDLTELGLSELYEKLCTITA